MDPVVRRITRIVGPFDAERSLVQLAPNQVMVKPNSYSRTGNLIDGNALRHISYGGVSVIPVSMTYSLDPAQQKKVVGQMKEECEALNDALTLGNVRKSNRIGRDLLSDLCACLQSAKNPTDHTLGEILSNVSVKCATDMEQIIGILKGIPGWKEAGTVTTAIANCCHPLKINRGKFSGEFLDENEKECLEDARKAFVGFLTDSSLEQDHYGMKKIDDQTLSGDKNTFHLKARSFPHSRIHLEGIDTLEERSGVRFEAKSPPIRSPLKKKAAFEKANSLFAKMEEIDSPRINEAFGRVMSSLGLGRNPMKWNRLVAHSTQSEVPFIVPVIVENLSPDQGFPTRYSPLQALDLMNDMTTATDWTHSTVPLDGSANDESEGIPFPNGSAAPFDPPRRVKKEVV